MIIGLTTEDHTMRLARLGSLLNYRHQLIALTLFFNLSVIAFPTFAHVAVDFPNGGESLDVGSTVTILWHDVIPHGPANYDLWYSAQGPDGPWVEVAADLTFPEG